jgi:actin-like ATPase involved in cell morphogenesis
MLIAVNNMHKEIHKYFSELGKRSIKTMTPEQRSERAKKAVAKRWENYKLNPKTMKIKFNNVSEELDLAIQMLKDGVLNGVKLNKIQKLNLEVFIKNLKQLIK